MIGLCLWRTGQTRARRPGISEYLHFWSYVFWGCLSLKLSSETFSVPPKSLMYLADREHWPKQTLQSQNRVQFLEWTSARRHDGLVVSRVLPPRRAWRYAHWSFIAHCVTSASFRQEPHETSWGLWRVVLSRPTEHTLCSTRSSSPLSNDASSHFWVQVTARPPREDTCGHTQRPFIQAHLTVTGSGFISGEGGDTVHRYYKMWGMKFILRQSVQNV